MIFLRFIAAIFFIMFVLVMDTWPWVLGILGGGTVLGALIGMAAGWAFLGSLFVSLGVVVAGILLYYFGWAIYGLRNWKWKMF